MAIKLLYGAPIYTLDRKGSVKQSLVISDDEIKFVGDTDIAVRLYPRSERVDLKGGCVIPGFIDAHMHLKDFSLLFRDLDLTGAASTRDILEGIAGAASQKGEGEWVVTGGADYALIEKLTRKHLDEYSGEKPVVVYSRDMHSLLANSSALEHARIHEHRSDPLGGVIVRDETHTPTGILQERACELMKKVIPQEEAAVIDEAIERGMQKLMQYGVTGFCDCSLYAPGSSMFNLMKIWRRGGLPMRGVLMFGDREASRLGALGIPSLFGNDMIRIGGCKIIMDGSLSSLTGYMSRPYRGTDSTGMLLMNEKELSEIVHRSYSHYIWTAVHAIGDRANEIALNVYEKIRQNGDLPRLLMRVEHAQSLKDEDVRRFGGLGVIGVVNAVHIPGDREKALKYLGSDAALMYRFRSLLDAGATLALASDAPAGSIDPLHGIYMAVERKKPDEGPELRFFPREKLTLEESVRAYTMGGAAAIGQEEKLGTLEAGRFADLVHLSEDIFKGGSESLMSAKVLRTYVAGALCYARG